MAISKTQHVLYLGKTLDFNNAYIKVSSLSGNKTTINLVVDIFDTKDGLKISGMVCGFVHDPNESVFKQAYEYLKTLPEFSNAADC